MTGRAPARLHLTTFLPGRADAPSQKLLHPQIRQQLPLEETTLAEQLRVGGLRDGGDWEMAPGRRRLRADASRDSTSITRARPRRSRATPKAAKGSTT